MTYQHILYKTENNIATITLNRPDVHNAFDENVIAELTAAFKQAGQDGTVRAVVLRGNGKSFCAGGDLNWMRRVASYDHQQNVDDAMGLATLLKTINTLPKPTIALVHGNAFGGGVGLTACCDIAFAEETAQFCLSEVLIGLIPSIIQPYVLTAIGERNARRYSLTAERFDGKKAQELGLVHEVVPVGGLDAAATKIVDAILQGAPGAQAHGKELIIKIAKQEICDKVIQYTAEQIAKARASAEGKEGLDAFLNKRSPNWRPKK